MMVPGFVMVDLTDAPAVLLISRTAEQISRKNLANAKRYAADRPEVTLIEWTEFPAQADDVLGSFVKHDDYPDRDVPRGMTALIAKFPGLPFGLTWNNGGAVTANDYEHARFTWDLWARDPGGWTRLDPRRDPVAPDCHFVPLLGDNFARS